MSDTTKKHLMDVFKAAAAAAAVAFATAMIRGLGLDHVINPITMASMLAGFFALKFRT